MRILSVLLLFLLSFIFPSCIKVFGKITFADGKNWIPKDFRAINGTLLIEEYPDKNINEEMIEYLRKNYRGKYEVAERELIFSEAGEYSDKEWYRFAFLWETTDMNTKPTGHFFDRTKNKHYVSTSKANRYQYKNAYKSYINTIDLFYKK